ncbi:hypothetical protein G210_2244 [Candida maltosa Xu316]|uniref:Uncharacterized protein n=1 Tax=Candida maltosa (strain Xu316) TaxID=1245528 RepID=M3JWY1_CANMX|nr:hypothetical protein G210_2244 [Candida maltosa Xu316]
MGKQSIKPTVPFTRIDSNVYENSPNLIQRTHSIVRNAASNRELSNSSNEVFFEASPVLEEPVYFPSLLDETNYPSISVKVQPHMTKPLTDCPLTLQNIVSTNIHAFPLHDEIENKDESTLARILEHEMNESDNKSSWFSWFSPDTSWNDLINHVQEPVKELHYEEVYLDQVFKQIYYL